jgi:integrase
VERPEFELRTEVSENLHPTMLFAYEVGCRTGALKRVVWPWVNLGRKEICFPPGVLKNKKPLIVSLSEETRGMLKKKFRGGPVFDTTNPCKEWNRACVKVLNSLSRRQHTIWSKSAGQMPRLFPVQRLRKRQRTVQTGEF